MKKISHSLTTISLLLLCISAKPGFLYADEELQEPANKPRTFSLGLSLFSEHGFGGTARLRFNHFAIDGGVGFGMIFTAYEDQYGNSTNAKIKFPFQTDAGLIFFFNDENSSFQNGLRLSGIYNQALGYGGMLGWVGEFGWNNFAISLGLGLQYYPDYESNLSDYLNLGDNTEVKHELDGIELYFGVNFIWYLF